MHGGTLGLAVLLILQMLSSTASASPGTVPTAPSLTYHDPIFVQNDLWAVPGVTSGSGTPEDPYIIEGWKIATTGSTGVLIRNTTAAFVLRNLTVEILNSTYDGVVFDHVRNARMENVTVAGAGVALDVSGSTNVTLIRSSLSATSGAAMFGNSARVLLQRNLFSAAMGVRGCYDVQILENNFLWPWGGGILISRSQRVTARYNLVEDGYGWGIDVNESHDVDLSDLFLIRNALGGVQLLLSDRINLTRIHTEQNRMGIKLTDTTNVTMRELDLWYDSLSLDGGTLAAFDTHTIGEDNQVQGRPIVYEKGCPPGTVLDFRARPAGEVVVVNCPGVRVSNLSVSNQQVGLLLAFVEGGEVFNNSFQDLNVGGLTITWSHGVVAHHNFFVNVDVDDPSSSNSWNAPYPFGGNWWSDYHGPDECSGPAQSRCPDPDGIGDVPAPIRCCHDVPVDNYPLMWPWNRTGSAPHAVVSVNPDDPDTRVSVTLNASASSDPDNGPIQVRWDWEGDGLWDTWWSSDLVAEHTYASPGTYQARVAVRDRDGYWTVAVRSVVVGSAVTWDYTAAILGVAIALGLVVWAVRRRTSHRGRAPPEVPPGGPSTDEARRKGPGGTGGT